MRRDPVIQVGIAYAEPAQQIWLRLDVPEGATVREAILHSGILEKFPHLNLDEHKVGIFGKLTALDAALRPGDRIEIYRAITCDPRTVPRRDGAGDSEEE
jgi:uncharacterized protein